MLTFDFKDIEKDICIPRDAVNNNIRMTILGDHEVYIENIKCILHKDSEKIIIKAKNKIIKLYGNCLKINHYTPFELKIYGKIIRIDFE